MTMSIVKQPSALIPLAMSCAALDLVLGHIALVGVARMAGQVPVVAFFAITWLPRSPQVVLSRVSCYPTATPMCQPSPYVPLVPSSTVAGNSL
jgi:hypothetical protein